MPNVRKTPATEAGPSIILLEDYPALATAISSALRKFAPQHSVHAARSLKELEALASKSHPELLLLDVDPPWPRLTQLLGKLRSTHAATRVLVIGATVPKEILGLHGSERALQFLHKTFDVPELGAAVQALLGPWTDTGTDKLRGTLRCFSAVDAALLQCASGRSVTLEVTKKNSSKTGELHFVNGQLRHAENGRHSGVEALGEIFSWRETDIAEKERKTHASPKGTIPSPWTEAFADVLLDLGGEVEEETPVRVAPPPEPKREAKAGKSLVLIDDTDMLLLFVEDVLATDDPDLRIATAATGAEGVRVVGEILPDLVLLDYSLPDFNGDEVCRRLLQAEQTARIPILMMSGHVAEMNRTAAEMENVVATIQKPFLSEALVTLVRETLAGRRRKKALKPAPAAKPVAKTKSSIPQPEFIAPPSSVPARTQRTPQRAAELPESVGATEQPEELAPPPIAPSPPIVRSQPIVPSQPIAPPTPIVESAPIVPPQPVVQLAPIPVIPIEPPRLHVVAAPPPTFSRPPVQTLAPFPARIGQEPPAAIPVLSQKPNETVLGLFLEVVSIQLTPALRMGTLRARPSSQTVSLQIASPALAASLPPTGFQLGAVDLDRNGKIANLRIKPTVQPFTPLSTRNLLQIGSVSVVPHNSHENLQLTPTPNGPMRMQLIAHFETAGVELSNTFQISNIVLKNRTNRVRVTLSEHAITADKTGTVCEISGVQIDGAAHIVELTLEPV